MNKHTLGKWEVHIDQNGWPFVSVGFNTPDGWIVAEVCAFDCLDPEAMANARLISAAPELLAACDLFMKARRKQWPNGVALEQAEAAVAAAIAKARGEPAYAVTPEGRAIAAAYKKRQEGQP